MLDYEKIDIIIDWQLSIMKRISRKRIKRRKDYEQFMTAAAIVDILFKLTEEEL